MDNKAENLFFEADELIDNNKIVEAKELLLELLSEFPDYGRAHNHLGWIYQVKFSDYKKAKSHYDYAMKYAPEYPGIYANYSYLMIDMARYDEMIKFGNKFRENKIADRSVLFDKMAQAYELKGNNMEAHRYYKLAIKETLNNKALEGIYASINRLKNKMNFFQKLKLIIK